jgi:hypothetical protein
MINDDSTNDDAVFGIGFGFSFRAQIILRLQSLDKCIIQAGTRGLIYDEGVNGNGKKQEKRQKRGRGAQRGRGRYRQGETGKPESERVGEWARGPET